MCATGMCVPNERTHYPDAPAVIMLLEKCSPYGNHNHRCTVVLEKVAFQSHQIHRRRRSRRNFPLTMPGPPPPWRTQARIVAQSRADSLVDTTAQPVRTPNTRDRDTYDGVRYVSNGRGRVVGVPGAKRHSEMMYYVSAVGTTAMKSSRSKPTVPRWRLISSHIYRKSSASW